MHCHSNLRGKYRISCAIECLQKSRWNDSARNYYQNSRRGGHHQNDTPHMNPPHRPHRPRGDSYHSLNRHECHLTQNPFAWNDQSSTATNRWGHDTLHKLAQGPNHEYRHNGGNRHSWLPPDGIRSPDDTPGKVYWHAYPPKETGSVHDRNLLSGSSSEPYDSWSSPLTLRFDVRRLPRGSCDMQFVVRHQVHRGDTVDS